MNLSLPLLIVLYQGLCFRLHFIQFAHINSFVSFSLEMILLTMNYHSNWVKRLNQLECHEQTPIRHSNPILNPSLPYDGSQMHLSVLVYTSYSRTIGHTQIST